MNKVFAYGTLRTKGKKATHYLEGYAMYNAGPFPYIVKDSEYTVDGEIIEVTDEELAQLDRYENIKSGLYTRESVTAFDTVNANGDIECFVYVAGNTLPRIIPNGDWFNKE